ncbi:ParA family protein [Frankia sp. AgB1.9]|uniref:ParA family protein n=1 Tax=unclassified Frankia TaxID=2632575 RepID=UPI0019330B10|nr:MULTISPECIES: ParA family protein [unclassified Frankia]MBL7488915.1 ParA family protein [Frankia sp. AgW1.1]MBL7546738.1 ParA family protein [Frankia sp. AgB1.9]MBL7621832.1 ParA family protein [Frankia sp. AgB1.8]
MKVATVVNSKGGVGKTTLTANLGAELARRGRRVLLLDLDFQASLTHSFFRPADVGREIEWRTVADWYAARGRRGVGPDLMQYVSWPQAVRTHARRNGGELAIVASDPKLEEVAARLGVELGDPSSRRYQDRHRRVVTRLADGLRSLRREGFDYVLIDCRPDFEILTRSAVVASDGILVPAQPERLATFGIRHLIGKLADFKQKNLELFGQSPSGEASIDDLAPVVLGVVFTRVKHGGGSPGPIPTSQQIIDEVRRMFPTFGAMMRESMDFQMGVDRLLPAAFELGPDKAAEIRSLVEEFESRIGGEVGG